MTHLPVQVTECRVYPNPTEDERLKAYANIVLNGAFALDVKIINGMDGLFVAMPALPRKDGLFHDVAHPITKDLRMHIEDVVLSAYRREVLEHGGVTAREKSDRSPCQPEVRRTQRLCAVGA